MRIKIFINSLLVASFLIMITINDGYSQGTDLSRNNKPSFYVGISLVPALSEIVYLGTTGISETQSKGSFTFSGSLDAGYFFSKYIGISSGIGFISFKNEMTLAQYQSIFQDIDKDSETYEMRVTGSNIKEEVNLGFLFIPVNIIFRLPVNGKFGFFVQPGIDLTIPVGKSYINSGVFTYKGYYEAYNVLLENLPDYGFPTNLSSSSDGKVETRSVCFNTGVACGIDFFINKKIQITVSGLYDKSLSNVSGYTSTENFQLSPAVDKMNSLMGGYTKASTSAFGLSLTFRYYLK